MPKEERYSRGFPESSGGSVLCFYGIGLRRNLRDVFLVGHFHVVLVHDGVLHGGVNLGVTQNFLNLLDGHAFVNRPSRHSPAELVGMDGFEIQHAAHFAKADLHTADGKAVVGGEEGDEQRAVGVPAAFQVILEVDFRLGVEIHAALLVALAENDALSGFEIHILDVEADQLAHADSGGVKQVNHGQVAQGGATVPEIFNVLVGDDLLHGFFGFDFVDAAHGAFQNVVLLFQPREKTGNVPTNVVDGRFAAVPALLIIRQIFPHPFRRHFSNRQVHRGKKVLHRHFVILKCPRGTAFDGFGFQEKPQVFVVRGLSFRLLGAERLYQHFLKLFELRYVQNFSHFVRDCDDFFFHDWYLVFG